MNQRQLEYFQALCELKNISRAAEQLFLTRQALSNSMRELEQELQTELFLRTKKGVELTAEGEFFLEFVRQQETLWQEFQQKLKTRKQECTLQVGTHLMHLNEDTLHSIFAFRETFPDIHINVHDAEDCSVFWHALRDGKMDVALTRKAPDSPDLCWIKLSEYRVFVLLGEDNPLARLEAIDFSVDLKGRHYLTVSQDTFDEIAPFIEEARISSEIVAPRRTLLKELLANEQNFFVLPEFAISSLMSKGVVAVPLNNFPIEVGGFVVFKQNPSVQVQKFINYMIEKQDKEGPDSKPFLRNCKSLSRANR